MRSIPNTDFPTYSDHVHPVSFARNTKPPLPYHSPHRITEPRPAWYECKTNVIRRVLMALNCEEVTHLYGVHIQRTDAFARITFHVNADCNTNGTFTRYNLEGAVARVLAIVEAQG